MTLAAVPGRGRTSTVSWLRERHRAQVLRQILVAGETTRAKLTAVCGLSTGTVRNVVADLTAQGFVHETGSIASNGGRPSAVIGPRPDGAYAVGADVGERGVAVELFDLAMNRVDREFRGGRQAESAAEIAEDLRSAVAALRERNAGAWSRLLGIGLGLPGLVETGPDGRQVLYAQSLGWPPVPVDGLVAGDEPVFAENGAKTLAKAEMWFGAARGVEHALVVLLGRGVGLAVISDGRLLRGVTSSAAEWGHTKVERRGRECRCGGRGCLEAYVGSDAILGAWRAAGGLFQGSGWRALGSLIEAAGSPVAGETDAAAGAVLSDTVETIGAALGGLVNLTNPQRIVIGGWVGLRLMESQADRIDRAIRANALDRPGSQYQLHACTFGGDTVALGAALLPVEALIATGSSGPVSPPPATPSVADSRG
jgi:predicted NBD/HSP70 family sugar kinase